MELQSTTDVINYCLPHKKDKCNISLNITFDDTGNLKLTIDYIEDRYLDTKIMKLFKPPLRFTTNVLSSTNIKDYVVSSKPDGIFTALYIDGNGIGYYLYPLTRQLFKFGVMTNITYRNIICSGELMEKDSYGKNIDPYIILFDILLWHNNILTNDLFKRINICNDIVKFLNIDNGCGLKYISVKSYVETKSIYRIVSSKHPRKDGVIFTLKNGKPGQRCIRWKPYPTLTVGLEYDEKMNDYLVYFSDTNHRRQFRKRYYNIHSRCYTTCNNTRSYLFRHFLISHQSFKYSYLKENINWDGQFPKNLLAELYIDYDPFDKSILGNFDIMKFRYDKSTPDNINNVNEILTLMYHPIQLSDILGKKSIYNYWLPASENSNKWLKYTKTIKKIIYERWATDGAVLDLCAGRGSDTTLLYMLSKKKKFSSIFCIEKDDLQTAALHDFTTMIRHDNLSGMDCNISILQGDINNPHLYKKINKKFNTIICSNAIQFALDPLEETYGIKNIKNLLNIDGILIIIFMNGSKLVQPVKTVCHLGENRCNNDIHQDTNFAEPIVDACDNIKYYYTCTCSDSYNPRERYEKDVGLFYTYEETDLRKDNTYYEKTHIWIKTPTALNAVREPIVKEENLIRQFQHLGFDLIEKNTFNSIKKSDNKLSSIYSYAIFKNRYEKLNKFLLFNLCDDIFFHIIEFLPVIDIFSLGMSHRIFTDKCLDHMKLKPIEWGRLYSELRYNQCDEINDWT